MTNRLNRAKSQRTTVSRLAAPMPLTSAVDGGGTSNTGACSSDLLAFRALATAAWLVWLMTGCAGSVPAGGRTTSAASCSSSADMGGLRFFLSRQNDGPTLMIVDNLRGTSNLQGTSDNQRSTSTGRVTTADGLQFEFQITSLLGGETEVRINSQTYHPARGKLFLIARQGEQVKVHQLQQDLSRLTIDQPSGTKFVNEHRAQFQPLFAGQRPADEAASN